MSATTGNPLVTATGFSELAAGNSNNLAVSVNTGALGSLASTVGLTLLSTTAVSGMDAITITPTATITTTGQVYSGQSVWSASGGGSWGTIAGVGGGAFGSNWGANQGSPGLDAGYQSADAATFGSALTSGSAMVALDGASPSLAALTFSNGTAAYTIAQGSGGTLTFNGGASSGTIGVAGTHVISAPIALGSDLSVTTTSGSDSLTVSGVIGGNHNLVKAGSGVLYLSAANSYGGTTTLNAGTVNLGAAETAGTSGPLGKNTAIGAIVLGGGYLQYSAANQYDYSGRFSTAANQQYNVDTNGQNVTWGTALTSSGGTLTKIGAGQLQLTSNASTYSGATIIKNGSLLVGGASNLHTDLPANTTIYLGDTSGANNAQISFGAGYTSLVGNWANNIVVQSGNTGTATIYGDIRLGGLSGGTITLGSPNSNGHGLTISGAGYSFDNGVVDVIQDPVGLVPGTAGTVILNGVTLSGVNTYTGNTRVAGNSTVGNAQALQNSTLDMNSLDTGAPTFSQASTLGGLMGSRNLNMSGQTLSIGHNGQNTTYSGQLNNGALTKVGAGSLTLSGSNIYAGATTVNSGKLYVNGQLTSSPVTVQNGATLQGTGTIGQNVIVTNGFIDDNLTISGSMTVNGNARWNYQGSVVQNVNVPSGRLFINSAPS